MKFTPENLGWKLYGLYEFSKVKLFNRPFIILKDFNKEEILSKLKENGFQDNNEIAIRFSKENSMNLPFFLGKFTLDKITEIIDKEKKDYIPFVHKLVKTKFSISLYYDGNTMFAEIWPGIGATKKKVFNENPDIIKINKNILISRYTKNREVEDVNHNSYTATPFSINFLKNITAKLNEFKPKLDKLLNIQNPLLCDLNCESDEDINFMGIQKSKKININKIDNAIKEYCVVKSLEDLNNYDDNKDLFFDIPIDRNNQEWSNIINILKKYPKVYVKSLTMHLSVILREAGINVEKGLIRKDYEVIRY
tara:strand:- start:153 stop:1076 length:924 start_codon:yes stop_codon:yes gene_type:complete